MTADDDARPIRSWHAHIYFDGAAQREVAAALREQIGSRFAVQLGRWRETPVGPHPRSMYQVAFEPPVLAPFVSWLVLHRQGLDVLLHPNTLAPRADHSQHALWLGQPLALKLDTLPASISADEDAVLQVKPHPR